ncbi:MAG: type II secretion system F family protein [Acidimicrobiia bacterium]
MTVTAAATGGSWMLVAGAAAVFVAFFLVVAAITLPGVRRRRLAQELAVPTEASSRSQMSNLGVKATEFAERGLAKHDREHVLATALERAGMDVSAPEYMLLSVMISLGAAAVGAMIGGPVVALIAIGLAVTAMVMTVSMKSAKRRKAFDEQLPDALALIAGGLRAGHSLPQAIDALVQEAESPTSDEFRRALFETQLGHTLPVALAGVAARVKSEDFDWVVQAIDIQREVGGDLAAVLDNVTRTIRDRSRLRRQIDTLTAEGRLSAIVLLALAIVIFLFLSVANPSYVADLTHTFAGTVMLIAGGALMVVGGLWLRRITRLVF